MKYKYDSRSDILLLKLKAGKPDFGEQEGNVITHYSKNFKPIEIEILDASKTTANIIKTILSAKRGSAAGTA